jgi:hypothetical protein
MDIYERQPNVKQLSIDSLPYRTSVNSRKVYYLKPASRKCKCMHITQDYHDKAKHLTTMAQHQVNYNQEKIYYYLDIENKKVVKLKEYHKPIKYEQVYYGTKTQALKKLVKMI